jgi:hypothetical protein
VKFRVRTSTHFSLFEGSRMGSTANSVRAGIAETSVARTAARTIVFRPSE